MAVSGGVDSVVLLHLLATHPGMQLIVAHFDHGIRPDSALDREFVGGLARQYGLPFVYDIGGLGPGTSEEAARRARYAFLHKVRRAGGARAVITAHHKDDALETAIINLIRGTGRRGLTSLKSTDIVKRPLLHVPKADIRAYAAQQGLKWREDSTNSDPAYLRNHIRHKVVPRLSQAGRSKFHRVLKDLQRINTELDTELDAYISRHSRDGKLDRHAFIMLSHAVAREVMASWLRSRGVHNFDKSMLERTVRAAKIYSAGRKVEISGRAHLYVGNDYLALVIRER